MDTNVAFCSYSFHATPITPLQIRGFLASVQQNGFVGLLEKLDEVCSERDQLTTFLHVFCTKPKIRFQASFQTRKTYVCLNEGQRLRRTS